MLNLHRGLLDASRVHQLETVRVPEDVQSINAAIQSCASGGQVLISPGTYDEPVLLDRDVQLIGVSILPALYCVFRCECSVHNCGAGPTIPQIVGLW